MPATNPTNAVRDHVVTLHDLAAGIEGVLVVSVFYANAAGAKDTPGTVTHHVVGDVDGMVAAIEAHHDTPNANVFCGLQVMRHDLHRGARGGEADIVAVLGLVADMDGDTGKIGDLPLEPSYVLETSPGNGQACWLLSEALSAAEAKPLAKALQRATSSDSGTGDIAHVWRIPGTLNWPNKPKLDRGRPPVPARVTMFQPFSGELVPVARLRGALEPWASTPTEVHAVTLGDLPNIGGIDVSVQAEALLAADDVGDRSAHAASVVEQLSFDGHVTEEAASLFISATGNWTNRYTTQARKTADFVRMWGKWAVGRDERRAAAAKLVEGILPSTQVHVADNDNDCPIDPWARAKHPPLPVGLLPPLLERFARVQADIMGVDPGGLAAAAIAVCAAVIPDSIQIQVKAHDRNWTESARIWVALIGQPSAKKSPVISAASAPLKVIDREMSKRYAEERAEYDALAPDQRVGQAKPTHERLRLEDTTIEAAQEVLKDSPNGLLCLQDELSGWFGSMEKYSSGKGSAKDRGFWLQSFNGGSYTVTRVGRGAIWIDNLSVSLLGGIQPDPIRRIAAEMHDDGLMQRLFPICMGESSVGKDEPTPNVTGEYAGLVERLHQLCNPKSGMLEVPLRFDTGAQQIRTELAQRHHGMVIGWEPINKKLAAHFGKYDGLFARLCVIWHCAESTSPRPASVVPEDVARRVSAFLHDFLAPHAIAFYLDVIGMTDRHDALLATAGYILAHGLTTITGRDVRRGDRTMRALDASEAEVILERLDALGWLEPMPSRRIDSTTYSVLPSVHTLFRERAAAEAKRRAKIRATIVASVAA